MNNQNIKLVHPVDLKTFDFQAQFKRCEEWNDPEQWDWLAILYYQRGYYLNAVHCFQRADACRGIAVDWERGAAVAVETEKEII